MHDFVISGDDDDDEAPEEEKVKDTGSTCPAIYGSRAMSYGGGNDLIEDQFSLYTAQQKHNQIVLIQVCNESNFQIELRTVA